MDKALLLYEMNRRDISEAELSRKIGLGEKSLKRRLRGDIDFRLSEMVAIAEALDLEHPETIFFAPHLS